MNKLASLLESSRRRRHLRVEQEIAVIEGYADPNSPNPAHRPPPKRRWATPVLGACVLSVVGPFSLPAMEALKPSSRQERAIERGAHEALGNTSMKVTCIPEEQMFILGLPFSMPRRKAGAGLPHTGITWETQGVCDAVEEFMQQPVTTADLKQRPLSLNTELQLSSLGIVAHEAGHAVLDETNEANAECIALQLAPDLAVAYGMNSALKPIFQERLLEIMTEKHQVGGLEFEEYHFNPVMCRPGGSADLSSQNLGTQVHFPEHS